MNLNIRFFELRGQFAMKYGQTVVVITSDFNNLSSLAKLSIMPVTKTHYAHAYGLIHMYTVYVHDSLMKNL